MRTEPALSRHTPQHPDRSRWAGPAPAARCAPEAADGWTRTITVTADTTITKGGQAIKVGDLDVGDTIAVRQKRNDDGTYSIVATVRPSPKATGEVTAGTASRLAANGRRDQAARRGTHSRVWGASGVTADRSPRGSG